MAERPILFSAPMIRAILAGQKTQTRRLAWITPKRLRDSVLCDPKDRLDKPSAWQKVAVGDRLWIREAWYTTDSLDKYSPAEMGRKCLEAGYLGPWAPIFRPADNSEMNWEADAKRGRARASMHMPRWLSRITLAVTAVKIERLQGISEDDAIAEGLIAQEGDGGGPGSGYKWKGLGYHGGSMGRFGMCFHTPKSDGSQGCSCNVGDPSPAVCAYHEVWDRINGKGGWEKNPYVVAVSFERANA